MTKYESNDVVAVCTGREIEVLGLAGIPETVLDGRGHPCPACGGTDRFSFRRNDARVQCRKCFPLAAGSNGLKNTNIVDGVMHFGKLDFSTAVNRIGDHLGMTPSRNDKSSKAAPADIIEAVAKAKRMPVEAFRKFGVRPAKRGKVEVARVNVYNECGKVHSYFDLTPEGKGWFPKGAGKAGLFFPGRIPQAGETWIVVEGVKDAAALVGLGFNACGLNKADMTAKYAELFHGVQVITVHDLDSAGTEGAQKTASRLYHITSTVSIARLPGEITGSGGHDVRDVLHSQDGERLVRKAIENAQVWEPPTIPETKIPTVLSVNGRTDSANGQRLVEKHGTNIRWCAPWKKWLVWDSKRWKTDDACVVEKWAKTVAEEQWKFIGRHIDNLDRETRNAACSFAKSSNSANGKRNALEMARSEDGVPILPSVLDTNPWLLNVQNGTLNLKTGELRAHHQKDYITKLCPVKFDPNGDCPIWLEFIDRIMNGQTDLINFIRGAVGLSLTGQATEHVLFFCYGTGANGKSVFLNTLQSLFGADYGMKAPPELLMTKRSDTHPTERADLHGKRFVACIEAADGCRLAESLVKELTGGDRVRARRMREDFWEFDPTHKLWLAANHKPIIRGTDHGIWRRIKLIPFDVTIPDDEQDKNLTDKLTTEMPGILNWARSGCAEWQAKGLCEPHEVSQATGRYRDEMDIIGRFIADECVTGEKFQAGATQLYDQFKDWGGTISQTRFADELAKRKFESDRFTSGPNKGRRLWRGIGLVAPPDE